MLKQNTIFIITMALCAINLPARAMSQINSSSVHNKEASDGLGLRAVRRVGLGSFVAGSMGAGGVALELNFTPATSVLLGYGGGRPFQSFTLQVKHSFGGRYFVPYIAGGYARWYGHSSTGLDLGATYPSFLGDRFIRKPGEFVTEVSEDLIYPAFGLQYLQLDGPWAGLSFQIEGVALIDIVDLVAVPTASLGLIYYF